MTKSRFLGWMAVAGLALDPMASTAMAAPEDIIAARQAGYKRIGEHTASIRNAVAAGQDVAPLAGLAKEIADWGRTMPTLFPPGTESGRDTKARPAIWSDRANFDKAAANLATEADKLAQLAQANDKDGFARQFKATGATCGACHTAYRSR
ncbi:c-type cytochrome [Limobrevibacterium gyesilva]|uniref:Cytochrome c n=1 Tax=Limobrevibacterium gyesilva TaxID=2991712 RepID=A0AA41YW73_9PROT|nr:cytochrome c [Limobrevibacterium gyesilva]MCW3476502.1 cytochrome c [Limobrevibacterium gyesilva]